MPRRKKPIRIRVWCKANPGDTLVDFIEIDREEWDVMTKEEQQERLEEEARDFAFNHFEYGWSIVK